MAAWGAMSYSLNRCLPMQAPPPTVVVDIGCLLACLRK